MTDTHERLLKLDNQKLMDVVKNYRQYGYDEQLRESAILILADRGISKEQLQITGSFENKTYDYAESLFATFRNHSKLAFAMYSILLISRIAIRMVPDHSAGLLTALLLSSVISFVLYFVFFILSFLHQNRFYRAIGQDYGAEGALLYLFLGMPFYMFMYFYFRNQMKEKMKEIR